LTKLWKPLTKWARFLATVDNVRELYQELILDHNQHPRNFHKMDDATHYAEGNNPLCGDQLKIYLKVKDNMIQFASFEGQGCAISKASASLMTESLENLTVEQAEALFEKFHKLLTEEHPNSEKLGKLIVFENVKTYPTRVKCATLAWHAFEAALKVQKKSVTTE